MPLKPTPITSVDWIPQELSILDIAFPTNVSHLMPSYTDIPKEFKNMNSKWVKFQQDWFYSGINLSGLIAREGIDRTKAIRHLQAIQRSFEPKHEHKEAAVAYLASLWFMPESTWTKAEGK